MNALTNDQLRELAHLYITTLDGSWSHRTPKAAPDALVKRGYAEHRSPDMYRLTASGWHAYHALRENESSPSSVRAWCDGCGAVVAHRCVYDHVRGEVWECTACVKEGVR